MQKTKVLFISPSFYPATYYGGPIFINRAFCRALGAHDEIQLTVLTTDADGPNRRVDANWIEPDDDVSYPITYCRRMLPPDIAPGLLLRLLARIRSADIVHLNGVYSFTTIPTLALARLMRKPVVWSPLGALQCWEKVRPSRAKTVWDKICSSLCQPNRVLLHVTSETERAESSQRIANVKTMVLHNGIDVPPITANADSRRSGALHLLYIGRLHPIKGIENLLEALSLTDENVQLTICGEGTSRYERALRSFASDLKLNHQVEFRGQVKAEQKEECFREADVCIFPSFKESFGTVVVESLARGVPVIASHGTPWQRVEEVGCGLWVSNDPKSMAAAIERIGRMPLAEMGRRGRAWMTRDFSWSEVAKAMIGQYRVMVESQDGTSLGIVTSAKAI